MTTRVPIRCRTRPFSRLLAALGTSSITALAAAAPPESLPIELEWEGPASCPPSGNIDGDVRRILGDITLPESLSPISARVSVRESPDGRFEVRMLTTSGDDTRERALRTETCDEARDLVAFLLALLIDPRAREPTAAPVAKKPPPATKPPPAEPDRAPPPPESPKDEGGVRLIVGLSGTAEYGTLTGGSVGGELRAGVLFSGWSVEGRGAAWLPRHKESESVPGAGGEFSLFEAGILGCLRGALGEGASLQGCTGPALLSLRGEGYGVTTPASEKALFAVLSAELGFLVALSPEVSLRPALGALVPFVRPTFAIHDVGTIHRPSAIAGRASLGFEAQF
jgi:hypothetical protein